MMVSGTTEREARDGSTSADARGRVEAADGNGKPRLARENREPDGHVPGTGIGVVSILLADDRSEIRAGMRRALEHHGFAVVAEATDASQAAALAVEHRPQVCLLEVDLPGGGTDVIEEIRYELPQTTVAMLTTSQAEGDVIRALRAGANGYLLKTTAPDRLAVAVRALVRGEVVLPRALTSALVAELRKADDKPRASSRRRYLPRFARRFLRRRARSSTREHRYRYR